MKRFKLLFAALGIVSVMAMGCEDVEDPAPTQQNIVELAQSNPNLSTLVAAAVKAGLADELSADGNLTVFAPTNAAFAEFLSDNGFSSLDDVPVDVLQKVLLYHVLGAEVKSSAITTGYVKTLASYGSTSSKLNMYISKTSGVKINGDVNVTAADIDASNGVVHVVDKVIGLPTVVTFALADPNFSTLVAAVTDSRIASANLVATLSGDGPFTVFAPTNTAFGSLLTELSATGLGDIDAGTLEAVLKYHVVSGNVLSSTLTEGQVVPTVLGDSDTFTIGLTGGPKITDASSRVANIVAVDVQANNGVIHVIDKVILP